MKDISYLKSLHDEILAYTKAHDDLSESHHWLFDLPPFKDEPFNPKHIVFAINPAENENKRLENEKVAAETKKINSETKTNKETADITNLGKGVDTGQKLNDEH